MTKGYNFTANDLYTIEQVSMKRKTALRCDFCKDIMPRGSDFYNFFASDEYMLSDNKYIKSIGFLDGDYYCSPECVDKSVKEQTTYSIEELNTLATKELKDFEV